MWKFGKAKQVPKFIRFQISTLPHFQILKFSNSQINSHVFSYYPIVSYSIPHYPGRYDLGQWLEAGKCRK